MREFGKPQREPRSSELGARTCLQRIADNPAYRRVARHLPLDGRDATPSQLADPACRTTSEALTLAAIHKEIPACHDDTLKNYSLIMPAVIPAAQLAYQNSDQVTDELIQQKITWEGGKQTQGYNQGRSLQRGAAQSGAKGQPRP